MLDFISEEKKRLELLGEIEEPVINYFHALALLLAYTNMIAIFFEKIRGHPEVRRVPELMSAIFEHFQEYVLAHVNIERDQIFNRGFVGTIGELLEWQQAGYPLNRTNDTYERRAEIFRAIWRGTNVTLRIQRTSKRGTIWYQNITFVPRKMDTFQSTTYEEILQKRNTNYSSVVRYIPFWLPLNYGTGSLGSNAGYPAVPGLHFIDIAEQAVPQYLAQAEQWIDSYFTEMLDSARPLVSEEEWAHSNIRTPNTFGIDVLGIAAEFAA